MSDHLSKTLRNLNKGSLTNLPTKDISPEVRVSHLPVDTLTELQDVDVRRSPRNVGKASIVKKIKQSSQKMYPGSGTKPHLRRSFRTPIQTIPLKNVDGKTEYSASKSFTVMPDQDEMVTPRSAIEGFIATADTQPRTFKTASKVPQKAVAGTSGTKTFKTPEQPDHVAPLRIYPSITDTATPGSNLTPRENIWNLLHNDKDQTQTPVVITRDRSENLSAKSDVSTMKLRGWGQEVTLSPLHLSQSSDGREDSPSFSMKSMKRTRRSFHIKAPQPKLKASRGTKEQTSFDKEQKTAQSDDDFGNANENLEYASATVSLEKCDSNISGIYSSAPSTADDILNAPVTTREAATTTTDGNMTYISMKETNLLAEEGLDDREGIGIAGTVAENVRQNSLAASESGKSDMRATTLVTVDDMNRGELIESAIQDRIDHVEVENEFVHDGGTLDAYMDVDNVEDNFCAFGFENIDATSAVQEEWMKDKSLEVTAVDSVYNMSKEGVELAQDDAEEEIVSDVGTLVADAAEGNIENNSSALGDENIKAAIVIQEEWRTDENSGDAILDNICDLNKEKLIGSVTQVVEEDLVNDGGTLETDVEEQNRTENSTINESGLENVEKAANEGEEKLRKDKNLMGSGTSFTSKHGEISFSATPKKSPKSTQAAVTPNASIYNLSDESSSSSNGGIHFSKPSTSSVSPRKGRQSGSTSAQRNRTASKRGITATESFRQGTGSSEKRSKRSYSEWKSLQKGKNSADQTIRSFHDIHPPRSSTPADRTKRMLHSTRIQNSVIAHTSQDQSSEAFTSDPILDISPIQPNIKSRRQTGSRHEIVNVNADKGYENIGENNEHSVTRKRTEVEIDMESSDDDLMGFSHLATPHIDMDKRTRVTSAGQKSAERQHVQKGSSGSGKRKETAEAKGHPTKRAKRTPSSTALPRRSVKFFAERHSTMKLSKDAVEEIEKASEVFWENTFKALEAYALHAGRRIINEQDSILLMEMQRLVKDKEDLHDKIRQYLPMELRSELIPMAKP